MRERHRIEIRAPLANVYATVRRLDMSRARLTKTLLLMRGMGVARGFTPTADGLARLGFSILAEKPNEELLIGLAGRFWTLSGGLCATDAASFGTFAKPKSARAAWNFAVAPTPDGKATILTTETRVQCTDAAARRRFRLYWLIVRPFSGLIRRDMLREVKRQTEASQSRTGLP